MSIPETISLEEIVVVSRSSPLPGGAESLKPSIAPESPALPKRIAVIGNYLPRLCGIATFTTDLCDALHAEYGATDLLALPINDTEEGYDYPERVRFAMAENDLGSYRKAADFINFGDVDLVCLQHEYGIFGGSAGGHILELLRHLQVPFITTLHTVLRDPNPDQYAVMKEITSLSDRLIVMSQHSVEILQEVFDVPVEKVDLIPHGVPDLPFTDSSFYKDEFGTQGKHVLLTFGLLSPNKGIENVIQALPAILARHPNVVYMVSGVTHPHVLRHDGEKYRHYLQNLAKELGVEGNIIFRNHFESPQGLVELIGGADIYITPYKHQAQVVSGTRGFLHTPENAAGDGIVLTHGAGQNCESPLLIALATAFCEAGMSVLRCDLPFRQVRPQGPPTWPGCAEHDRQGLRRAIEAMRKIVPGRVFLGGHSYGGRQSSMLAAEEPRLVPAILLLAYPLHPPKRPSGPRTAHFASLQTPAMFVTGTRDGFGTIDEMKVALKLIPARTELLAIDGAGHELMTAKSREEVGKRVVEAFLRFVSGE